MKRLLTVLVASLALVLAAGVETAWAGGLPGGELPAGQSQSIDQSQNATNSIDQTANAQSVAVNASPNLAVANSGSVDQSSNASSGAAAVNKNDSQQSNTLQNNAEQSQSGASADDNKGSCCERTSKRHGSQTQNADQSQDAGNSISQNAHAKSVAVNASPNVAVLNKGGECNCGGGVNQSSNASSAAIAANKNNSTQSNTLQDGVFSASVEARRRAVVLLKATYDPRWTVTVDGVRTKTEMMAPSLVGVEVSPGRHVVRFKYSSYSHYPVLLAIGALTLLGLALYPRRARVRGMLERWIGRRPRAQTDEALGLTSSSGAQRS